MNHKVYKKLVLVIIDGFGVASASHGNAISRARIPTFDFLVSNYPSLTLQASGPLVGLPWGEMGNSEVGHLNIGAGRIVGQDLPRITSSIQNGEFFRNKVFAEAMEHVKKHNSNLHLMGLVSPGGVHSSDEHLYALLGLAQQQGVKRAYVHMFTDGRDTDQKIAQETIKKLRAKIEQIGLGEIASVGGRFYTMDRGGHWNQTAATYEALVDGKGQTAPSAEECVAQNYRQQIFDEMIQPTVILDREGKPIATIADNDAVVFINFRQDRALQLTEFFVKPEAVPEQYRRKPLQNLFFVTMTEYASGLPVRVAFPPINLQNNLAEILASRKLSQFHIAESEKYAHVTAFFNCGRTEKWPGEERVIVTSPENSRNYMDHPEMSAEELTDILTEKISSTDINFFVANFANPDMVGHTGNLRAATAAVEFIDGCLKKILDSALLADACLLVTADHGNVEQMINPKTGDIDKDHTTNPVPFLLVANEFKFGSPKNRDYISLATRVPAGVVGDVAPTILELMGLPKPLEMTGINVLEEIDTVPIRKA